MDWITLNKIELKSTAMGTKVCYDYNISDAMKQYICGNHSLFVEYPGNLSNVPDAVLAIPFVGVMLTVTMLLDIGIKVPVLDQQFHDSIRNMEQVFQNMYPKAKLQAAVIPGRTEVCTFTPSGKSSLFFTGGVDATSALAELAEEKPVLINIWGGDLRLTDDASHVELEAYLNRLTNHIGTDYCFIKTNAREMFEETKLGHLCEKLLGHRFNHGWWASVAHILSMTATIAPFVWQQQIGMHFIGSSYDGKTKTFDSNNEDLIAAIRYAACDFRMVDSSLGRNEKVGKIIRYRNITDAPLQLKVCWQRTAGVNCSACEKCYRTIMNILANRGDPNNYGFSVDADTLKQIQAYLHTNPVSSAFWFPIQHAFLAERDFWESVPEVSWILKARINSPAVYLRKLKRKLFH